MSSRNMRSLTNTPYIVKSHEARQLERPESTIEETQPLKFKAMICPQLTIEILYDLKARQMLQMF